MLADAAMEYMNNETQRTADTKTEKQDEPPPLGKLIIVYKHINLSWLMSHGAFINSILGKEGTYLLSKIVIIEIEMIEIEILVMIEIN